MADLVIDYSLLHDLASTIRNLQATIQTDFDSVGSGRVAKSTGPTSAGTASSAEIGDSGLYYALGAFYTTCDTPFHDAMKRLKELADTFDGVAKAFFDVDADFAGKVNTARLQSKIGQWEADEAQYQRYLKLKDQSVTYQYFDKDGHKQTGSIPLWDPKSPAPNEPGAVPTSLDDTADAGTKVTLNDKHQIVSETSDVATANGLHYTETTTYTYGDPDGDGKDQVVSSKTTITHSDGSTETISKTTNPDQSSVMTDKTDDGTSTTTTTPKPGGSGGYTSVTKDQDGETTTVDVTVNPGKDDDHKTVTGPDGTDEYTGDASTEHWKLTSHEDPPSDDYYYV
jgi:hypothetical protein